MGAQVPAFLPRELVERQRATDEPRCIRREEKPRMRVGATRLDALPICGGAMSTHTTSGDEKLYHYYRCHLSVDYGRRSCRQRMMRAENAEAEMWGSSPIILKYLARRLVGMDALIERKRAELRGDPEPESKAWLERLAEIDQERRGYLKLAARGHMSEEELDEALADLEETRRTAEGKSRP